MGDYAGIGPVQMWYATRGQGQPLVVLHEDLATHATWAGQLDMLAGHFRGGRARAARARPHS
jgi:hypothetical protein